VLESILCGFWVLGLWLLWVCLGFVSVAVSALCGFRVQGSRLWIFGCSGFVGFLCFCGLFRFSLSCWVIPL
jgi:hypothetical protein